MDDGASASRAAHSGLGHPSSIPRSVADHLGYYVYLYIDPRTNAPFYVGKGKGRRVLAHLSASGETRKAAVLAELRALDLQPRIDILAHALPSEETAFRIEAAVIDALRLDTLTNLCSGWRSIQFGRRSLDELRFYYAARPVEIADPVMLIRINRSYRHDMSPEDLYDKTRGNWKLGPRRGGARLALAVFHGIVREVYAIEAWHPAGTTNRKGDDPRRLPLHRWAFTGAVAPARLRRRYHGGSVERYQRQGQQNPVTYVNC